MFITFEGIDGCGKTTQIARLEKYLINSGREVIKLREPGGTPFSESIRAILLESKEHISAESELLLFNSARANLVQNIIQPALSRGVFVLCDRFFDSTTAYQGYGRGLDIEYVNRCNEFATRGLKPDLTFYLRVSLELAHNRSKHRAAPDRIEKSGDEFFHRVIAGFDEIAQKNKGRIVVIDSSHEIEYTSELIIQHIKEKAAIGS